MAATSNRSVSPATATERTGPTFDELRHHTSSLADQLNSAENDLDQAQKLVQDKLAACVQAAQQTAEHAAQLAMRDAELRTRESEFATTIQELDRRRQAIESGEQELTQRRALLEQHAQELDSRQTAFAAEAAAVAEVRASIDADRAAVARQQDELVEQRRLFASACAELEQQTKAVNGRAAALEEQEKLGQIEQARLAEEASRMAKLGEELAEQAEALRQREIELHENERALIAREDAMGRFQDAFAKIASAFNMPESAINALTQSAAAAAAAAPSAVGTPIAPDKSRVKVSGAPASPSAPTSKKAAGGFPLEIDLDGLSELEAATIAAQAKADLDAMTSGSVSGNPSAAVLNTSNDGNAAEGEFPLLPDGRADESRLSPEAVKKLRVLRRISGGRTPDIELLKRLSRELTDPAATSGPSPAVEAKPKKRNWWGS